MGDLLSIINMEGTWWRGKKGFEVKQCDLTNIMLSDLNVLYEHRSYSLQHTHVCDLVKAISVDT